VGGAMTITEAFEAFEIDELVGENRSQKTIDSYRCTLNSLLRSVGYDMPLMLLTYSHIIWWKKMMQERKNAPAHVAFQLRELRRVLTYVKSHGFSTLDPNEIKIPKFKYQKTGWLTAEEVTKFLSVIHSPRDKALFGCMFSSGGRVSEILSLDRDSIVDGTVQIWGKGKRKGYDEPDLLIFDPGTMQFINNYLEMRLDEFSPLFLSRQNTRIGIQQVIRLFNDYLAKAGVEKRGRGATHILRHSFATDLELNGLDMRGIQVQMRHKKLDTTRMYMHGEKLRKRPDYEKYHTVIPAD
jgi:integrase/recombinase XerD